MEDSFHLFWGSVLNEQCDVTDPTLHVMSRVCGCMTSLIQLLMSCHVFGSCHVYHGPGPVPVPVPGPGPGPVLSTPGSLTLVLSVLSSLRSMH